MTRSLVPCLLAAFAMLAAPVPALADDTDPETPSLVEAQLTPADGREIRGVFIDLGEGDRLLLRHYPMADRGVEVERVSEGEVVWRVRAEPLGVIHSIYTHDIYAWAEDGRLVLRSEGSSGAFIERRDLETGGLIERAEVKRSAGGDAPRPAVEREGVVRAEGSDDTDDADEADPETPGFVEAVLTPADGRSIRGAFIDLEEGARLFLRYSPMADRGVEIERVTDGEVVWRVRAEPLGVIHSRYRHEIYAWIEDGQLRLRSDGTSGRFHERRDLETGELIERSGD